MSAVRGLSPITPTAVVEAMAKIDAALAAFDHAGNVLNGKIPARSIDRWLKVHRQLLGFREHLRFGLFEDVCDEADVSTSWVNK
jgi:hypothetical protein